VRFFTLHLHVDYVCRPLNITSFFGASSFPIFFRSEDKAPTPLKRSGVTKYKTSAVKHPGYSKREKSTVPTRQHLSNGNNQLTIELKRPCPPDILLQNVARGKLHSFSSRVLLCPHQHHLVLHPHLTPPEW
jgi:hypothetical protein